MNDSSKYNSFTAADIDRYHKGQMTAAERHALEKAALDDPFLADALEGYAFTASAATDLKNIKARLEEKHDKRKVVALFSKKYNWLQLAALFLIVAGAGWFLYRADFISKKEIAIATPAKAETAETFSTTPPVDSNNIVKTAPQETTIPEGIKTKASVASRKINKPVKQEIKKVANEKQQVEIADVAAATARENNLSKTRRLARRMAAQNKEIAASTNPTEQNNKVVVFDNSVQGRTATDSVSGFAMAQKKKEDVPVQGDTIKTLNVVMQPSKDGMNEVVVVGFGAKTKATAKPVAKFEELEPAEGWTNFNDYIAQNLRQPEELKEKTISGNVELSFDINKEGEPVNITVEKSLCSKCDEEAVRLLKEGPRWKKKKDKKGKISIRF